MKKYILLGLLTVFITAAIMPAFVYGASLSVTKQQKKSVDSKIDMMTQQKLQILLDKKKLEGDKAVVASQQTQVTTQLNDTIKEISDIDAELSKMDDAIVVAEADYQHHLDLFKIRLNVMYQNSDESMLDLLLDSKDMDSFFEKVQFVSSLAQMDKQMIAEVVASKDDLEYKKSQREQVKQQEVAVADQKQDRIVQLTASRSDLDNAIRTKDQKAGELSNQLDELEKLSLQLNDQIKKLQSKANYIGGNMIWPCPGNMRVVSPFGMRLHPILKVWKMHTGIDIDAKTGDANVAANSGKVIIAGWDGGYGNTVVIDHGGGITTLYAHASKLLVHVGDIVKQGQTVSLVGMTGLATGPHLHFEIRVNGVPVDPLKFGK